jgi:hypothetical protein
MDTVQMLAIDYYLLPAHLKRRDDDGSFWIWRESAHFRAGGRWFRVEFQRAYY